MLEYTLCNELLHEDGLSLAEQAEVAAALGYVGLELAPHSLGDHPHALPPARIDAIRRDVEQAGIRVTGLHWLLSGYPDVSITDPDQVQTARDILIGLVDLCAALGGERLIHGSPRQRPRPTGVGDDELIARLADFFDPIATRAERCGVVYCIEPLSRVETETINTVADGVALVDAVGSPAFLTMIDCSAAGQTEPPVADRIRDRVPSGVIGHLHANDTNRGAPGMGDDPFDEIVQALVDVGWDRPIGVEPFRTVVDARVTAAIGIATLRASERAAR